MRMYKWVKQIWDESERKDRKWVEDEEERRMEGGHLQLMLLLAKGFKKNTQSSLCFACTHTYTILHTDTHINTQTQVGLRSLVCQFVVPLVPSQEAHRQASSHAWTGTGPYTNTVVPGATVHCVCVCVCSFFCSHRRQMLKNWEHVKKIPLQPFSYGGKWNTSNMCVWLWFTLKSQREWLHFDSFTRLLHLFIYWQISKCRDKPYQLGMNLTK